MLDSTTFTLAVKGRPSRSSRRSRIDPGSRCLSPRARQPRRLRSTRVTTPRPSSDALSWMATRGERLALRPLAEAVGLLGVMWCGTRTILGWPPGALKGRATAATRAPFGRYSTPDADSPYAPRHRRERAVLRDLRPARAGPRRARSPASPSVLAGLGGPGARHPLLAAGGGALAPVRPLPARRHRLLSGRPRHPCRGPGPRSRARPAPVPRLGGDLEPLPGPVLLPALPLPAVRGSHPPLPAGPVPALTERPIVRRPPLLSSAT